MKLVFLVNEPRALGPEQTTSSLIANACSRGHEVCVVGVGHLTVREDGGLSASALRVSAAEPTTLVKELSSAHESHFPLDDFDACVVRTNPARDAGRAAQHLAALRILDRLGERGVPVLNHPRGLWRASNKLSLFELPPTVRPRTLVTHDRRAIEAFVERESRAVIKPLEGTRGRDVFVLESGAFGMNRAPIIDVVLRQGYAVVQEFVTGAEQGDVRVTVVEGEVLEVDGVAAAIRRMPGAGDFRSNLHAGGSAAPTSLTEGMREAVARIAPVLLRDGLFHVGVDFVGSKILELNVFSPGGLHPCERAYGLPFGNAVIERLERRLAAS